MVICTQLCTDESVVIGHRYNCGNLPFCFFHWHLLTKNVWSSAHRKLYRKLSSSFLQIKSGHMHSNESVVICTTDKDVVFCNQSVFYVWTLVIIGSARNKRITYWKWHIMCILNQVCVIRLAQCHIFDKWFFTLVISARVTGKELCMVGKIAWDNGQ